jgi:uncharacterized protein (DUF934 family)
MNIIKDKKMIEDSWVYIADEDTLSSGNIIMSLSKWREEKSTLRTYSEKVGVKLLASESVEAIAGDLDLIALVALEFPAFTDGRSFSHARLLRSRYGFDGEIRAIGGYMADQVYYLSRVGVNAFQLGSEKELAVALSTMDDFTVKYQESTH